MSNTYTTDWTSIQNGSQTTYNPQELSMKNALIDIESAEAQWRGSSETTYSTSNGQRENSDSAKAYVDYSRETNTNSDSERTTGDRDVNRDRRTITRRKSGQYWYRSGSISLDMPDRPRVPNANVEPERIEVDYYVDEDSGGDESNIIVSWDDDPYDAANYDSRTRIGWLNGYSRKRVGGFNYKIYNWRHFNYMDGGQIRFDKTGDRFGTSGLVIEMKFVYTVKTYEYEVDRDRVRVSYPNTPDNHSFNYHRIKTYINGNLDDIRYSYRYRGGQVLSELSPPNSGDTKRIVIQTRGTRRRTISRTASVDYPSVPNGWSFDRHNVRVYEDGNRVEYDNIYSNRGGQNFSRTSNNPSERVKVEVKTYYSKTISNTKNTSNPSLEGDYLPEGLNLNNVVFALDTSTSINQNKQNEITRQILSQLTDDKNSALVEFDYDANEIISLDSLQNNRDDIIDALGSLEIQGGTEIVGGLQQAWDSLDNNDGTIILISDGQSGDDPIDKAAEIGNDGVQIISIHIGQQDTETMEEISSVSDGFFFKGSVDTGLFGTTLNDDELSSWRELSGLQRTEQTLTHIIGGSEKAEFRIRFSWSFLTPEPTYGTTGFRDNSSGVWREAAVAKSEDDALQYNHVQVYHDGENEWGALDVVDVTNENAIDSHQFYDEDAGWLAPREFNTV